MRYRRILPLLLLAWAFGPAPARAQTITPGCQPLIAQNMLPLLQAANSFGPSGVYPVGFAPLAQPFATNPGEYALYGPPPAPPPSAPAGAAPDPQLTAAAILQQWQQDGTWDQLTPDQRADFTLRLAELQDSQVGRQIEQANLQQATLANVINARRSAYELASQYQERAQEWRDSYSFYAQTVLATLQTLCSPTTSLPGLTGTGVLGTTGVGVVPVAPGAAVTPADSVGPAFASGLGLAPAAVGAPTPFGGIVRPSFSGPGPFCRLVNLLGVCPPVR